MEDLALRVPTLNRSDLAPLARIGALNALSGVEDRRDAIGPIERVSRPIGPLLLQTSVAPRCSESPLRRMATDERLVADYAETGLTTGPHPVALSGAPNSVASAFSPPSS